MIRIRHNQRQTVHNRSVGRIRDVFSAPAQTTLGEGTGPWSELFWMATLF